MTQDNDIIYINLYKRYTIEIFRVLQSYKCKHNKRPGKSSKKNIYYIEQVVIPTRVYIP